MFNQQSAQRRPAGSMQPPPNTMQQQSHCEIQAKEKLMTIVYEYLVHSGAQKSAEAFKEEVLSAQQNPNVSCFKPQESAPGFLHNWFMIFWDLFTAASDRRDVEPSQDGKMYYDIFMQQGGYGGPGGPMMNGMPGMFTGGPMGMPGPDGMMGGFPQRFAGRGGPPGAIPGGYGMFPPGDPRALAAQRMPPNAMRMPSTSFAPPGPGMRPSAPGQGMGFRGGPYLDSPNQAFPPGAMMPNGMGTPSAMSMSSPGMPMNVPDGAHPPYMQGGMPSSSTAMPFPMGDTSVSMGNGGMSSSGGMGDGSQQQQQQMMMMNGDEVKQSPVSTPRGMNGGTPAPGSAQSGQPSSGTPGTAAMPVEEKPNNNSKTEDDEISKIKGGLLDDFMPKEEAADPALY